jgi:hypothetical protein
MYSDYVRGCVPIKGRLMVHIQGIRSEIFTG